MMIIDVNWLVLPLQKPFRCVVPNCDRMFSRFDNMMQHTHTHNRPKKKDSSDSSEGKLSPMSIPDDHSMMHVPSLPSSPATSTIMMENHHHLLNNEEKFASYYQHQPTSPASEKDFIRYKQQLYGYPTQHFSSSESTSASSQQNQRQWSPMYNSSPTSPPYNHSLMNALPPAHPPPPSNVAFDNVAQPPKPFSSVTLTDYFHPTQHQHQPRKNSMHSETTLTMLKRRLSYVDLSTPIQELGHSYSTPSFSSSDTSDEEADEDVEAATKHTSMPSYLQSRFKADGIDITPDEFEALQGFGKFCSEPVVREPILMTRITTSPTCSVSFPIKLPPLRNLSPAAVISNNTTSQINAFRQQISTSHESFSRSRT